MPLFHPLNSIDGNRILVVDDHEPNRLLVTTLLRSWGCRYTEAPDGETAYALLLNAAREGDSFRVAIIDMHMPRQDGAELEKILQETPEIRETKLVMMTTLERHGEASRLEQIGFFGYLTKPLRQSHYYDCLAMMMGEDATSSKTAAPQLVTRHTIAESHRHCHRILLAEDNAKNLLVAMKLIEKFGFRTDAVLNGKQVIASLKRLPYDPVLIGLPDAGMDGVEATRSIHAGDAGSHNNTGPIITITAHILKGDRELCIEAGMNDCLAKPVQPEDLISILYRWLPKKSSSASPSHANASDVSLPVDSHKPSSSYTGHASLAPEAVIFDKKGFLQRTV